MKFQYVAVLILVATLSIFGLLLPHTVRAETLVESDVDTRTVLAFRVNESVLRRWVPEPLQITPMAGGPYKGANLFIAFADRLVKVDAEGKPLAGGIDRYVVLSVPAKQPQVEKSSSHVIRAYSANPQTIPGPYKNSVQASIRRERTLKAVDLEPGTEEQLWDMRDSGGGVIEFRLRCQRGLPARAKMEQKVYSAVDPDFFQIYRVDHDMDVVKSPSGEMDRVQSYQFKVTVAELRELFDGTEQLVSIAIMPWYVLQLYLP